MGRLLPLLRSNDVCQVPSREQERLAVINTSCSLFCIGADHVKDRRLIHLPRSLLCIGVDHGKARPATGCMKFQKGGLIDAIKNIGPDLRHPQIASD